MDLTDFSEHELYAIIENANIALEEYKNNKNIK